MYLWVCGVSWTMSGLPMSSLTGLYGGAEYNWSGKLVRTEAVIDANSNTVQTIIRVKQPDGECFVYE